MFHASQDLYFIKTIVLATVADGCFLGDGLIFFIGTFWVVLSIVDHLNLVPFLDWFWIMRNGKKMLVTPLKQIALNGNNLLNCFKWKNELPGLSRTWAGDIMSLMLPHCLLGTLLCVLLCTAQVVLLLLDFCLLFRSAAWGTVGAFVWLPTSPS